MSHTSILSGNSGYVQILLTHIPWPPQLRFGNMEILLIQMFAGRYCLFELDQNRFRLKIIPLHRSCYIHRHWFARSIFKHYLHIYISTRVLVYPGTGINIVYPNLTGCHKSHRTPNSEWNQVSPIVAEPWSLQTAKFCIDMSRRIKLDSKHISTAARILTYS